MTKRFYQSLISYRYSFGLTLPAILIFVLAFIRNDKNISRVRPLMIILTIILAIMTFLYYKKKFACAKVFKNIQNPDEYYEHGGMAHHSMFLEDRMLVCENLQVTERPVTGIERIAYADGKNGKCFLYVTQGDTFTIECDFPKQARRVAAFFKRKNPDMRIDGITPEGTGSLKELGAEYKMKTGEREDLL